MQTRQRYTNEFKREAVRLLNAGEKSASDLARELGVRRNQLYKWQKESAEKGAEAFKGPGRRPTDNSDKLGALEKENARLREEVEILKKAAAYFARELP
jgi:transposase